MTAQQDKQVAAHFQEVGASEAQALKYAHWLHTWNLDSLAKHIGQAIGRCDDAGRPDWEVTNAVVKARRSQSRS